MPAGSAEPAFPGVNASNNQLVGATYDPNGNATALNTFGLSYDMENRLVSATSGTAVEKYTYDPANHRVERLTAQGYDNIYYYGPNGKVLATFQALLTPGAGYYTYLQYDEVYFGGLPLGTTNGFSNGEYSSIVDRLGTGHPGYPYGTDIGSASGSAIVDFATYVNESMTGFLYADQRWYAAGYGRFLTADRKASSARAGSPATWNRYTYGSNDPINAADPSGNSDICYGNPSDYGGEHCYFNPYDVQERNPPDNGQVINQDGNPTGDGCTASESNPNPDPSCGVDITPPPPPPPQPECEVQLFDQSAIFEGNPLKHTLVGIEVPGAQETYLEAGPGGPGNVFLNEFLNVGGTKYPGRKHLDFSTGFSTSACGQVVAIDEYFAQYPANTYLYWLPFNSNSYAHTLLTFGGVNIGFWLNMKLTLIAADWENIIYGY